MRPMHPAILVAAMVLGACAPDEQQEANAPAEPAKPDPTSQTAAGNAASAAPGTQPKQPRTHPCREQDGRTVPPNLLRAVGNEPFWGARIDGRCVTYSTPEDLKGTRIWTRFSGSTEQGAWTGALDGQRFELRTNPRPGCSDTMSDKVYPIEVTLLVRGEERRGCAEALPAGKPQ